MSSEAKALASLSPAGYAVVWYRSVNAYESYLGMKLLSLKVRLDVFTPSKSSVLMNK
jgi:hypothetical protein